MPTKADEERGIAGTVKDEDGRESVVMVDELDIDIERTIRGFTESDEVRIDPDRGMARLTLKVFEDGIAESIPLGLDPDSVASLTSGPLWWIPGDHLKGHESGVLVVDSADRLEPANDSGRAYDLLPVEDSDGLLAVFDNGRPVEWGDLIFGIAYVRGMEAAYEKKKADSAHEKEPEEVTLAQYKTDKVFVNHSLAMKVFNGLFDIAHGNKDSFDISPRNGTGNEHYRLTAPKDICSQFFFNHGGNVEQLKAVLETVYILRTSERAKDCVHNGRVWFTVNTIVEEMRRTTGGTVRAKNSKYDGQLVDAALRVASAAQIEGTKPNGDLLDVDYVIYAVRRDKITFNGRTYENVWGFLPDASTLNDYAREIRQAYIYPLLESPRPLTLDEAWIDRYLRDVVNEARGRLYTVSKNGRISKSSRRKRYALKRSWDTIFETASPLKVLDSRQKLRLVKTFEKVLKLHANMEKHGAMREGMPLYINAYSERDSSRGRGKGKWLNLVIECSSELHEPNVSLL